MSRSSQNWLAGAAHCRRLAAQHTDAAVRTLLLELAVDAERAAADAEIDAMSRIRSIAGAHRSSAGYAQSANQRSTRDRKRVIA